MRRFSTYAAKMALAKPRVVRRVVKPAATAGASSAPPRAAAAAPKTVSPSRAASSSSRSAAGSASTSTPSTPGTPGTPSTPNTAGTAGTPASSSPGPSASAASKPTSSTPASTPASTKLSDTLDTPGESFESDLNEDWATSFQGLGSKPFDARAIDILMAPVAPEDVEITPDGLLYLPEIKYRRILNRAFGPGGWGIAPRTKTMVTKKQVTREYGLVCLGRLVSVSRGEMDYFNAEGVTTAMEGCKSNALMRCCKDLGIASELWDPSFIRKFKSTKCDSKYFEKKRRFVWKRKDRQWEYPYNT